MAEDSDRPSLHILPADVLWSVFQFLSPKERIRLEPVCKRFQSLLKDSWKNFTTIQMSVFGDHEDTERKWTLSPEKTATLLRRCAPYVQVLNFQNWGEKDEAREAILCSLVQLEFSDLKELSFRHVILQPNLFQCLGQLHQLESLHINTRRVSEPDDLATMFHALKELKKLTVADLDGRPGESLASVSLSLQSLKIVNAEDPDSWEAEGREDDPPLVGIDLTGFLQAGPREELVELHLICGEDGTRFADWYAYCHDTDREFLEILLTTAPNLRILEFSPYLQGFSLNYLFLAKFQHLEELRVKNFSIFEEPGQGLFAWGGGFLEAMANSASCHLLRLLHLDGFDENFLEEDKIETLAVFTCLKTLCLENMDILRVRNLEPIFLGCAEIEQLSFPGCRLSDSILSLVGRLCPNLGDLNLKGSEGISFEGIQVLCEGIFEPERRDPEKSLSITFDPDCGFSISSEDPRIGGLLTQYHKLKFIWQVDDILKHYR